MQKYASFAVLVAVIIGVGLFAVTTAQAAEFSWTGGGGDNNWTTTANWVFSGTDQGASGYPDSTDNVTLGNDPAADAAQTINLDTAITVGTVTMVGTGNRAYTIDNSSTTLTFEGLVLDATAANNLTINPNMKDGTAGSSFVVANNNSSGIRLILAGDIHDGPNGTSRLGPSGSGTIEIQGINNLTSLNQPWPFTGVLILNSAQPLDNELYAWGIGPGHTLRFLADASIPSHRNIKSGGAGNTTLTIQNGEPDNTPHTFTAGFVDADGYSTVGLRFAKNPNGGTDQLTLELVNSSNPNDLPIDFGSVSAGRVLFNSTGTQILDSEAGLSGVISGDGAVLKINTGTLSMRTVNTYTGGTTITAGTVQLDNNTVSGNGQLPDIGLVSIASGGTLNLNGFSDTIGGLAGAGDVELGSATLTVSNLIANTFSGGIGASAGSALIKKGTGTLTLNGSMAQDTTTIAAGTLGGNGTFTGALTVDGGTISPGLSAGTITIGGDMVFEAGSTYAWEPGDLLDITGELSATGAWVLDPASAPSETANFTIATADGGVLQSVLDNGSLAGGLRGSLNIVGNDLIVGLIVPEPSTVFLLGIGSLTLWWFRRRKV